MHPGAVVISTLLILLGAVLGLSAYGAFGPWRRLRRIATRPVSELSAGMAEVSGTLRALAPLRTVEDAPAIVVRTQITTFYDKGSKGYQNPGALDRVEASQVELTDASGTCELHLDEMLLLAPTLDQEHDAAAFEARFPEFFAAIKGTIDADETLTRVRLQQAYLPDGIQGFVSGEAVRDGSAAPAEGYRATRQRFRFRGESRRPLIVSAWAEPVVRSYFLRPVLTLAWLSLLCFATAGVTLYLCARIASLGA